MKIFFIFAIGICLGSFLNVLVDRGQKGKSLWGFSKCDFCGHKLSWWENIPILSFLFLKGKCNKCRKKLSWQYPIVELSVGLVFLAIAFWTGFFQFSNNLLMPNFSFGEGFIFPAVGNSVEMIFLLLTAFLLSAIFLWDLKYMIISDKVVFAGVGLAVAFSIFQELTFGSYSSVWWQSPFFSGLLGALAVSLFFYLMYFFSAGKWIGGGDVKLGFWLGWLVGIGNVYPMLLVSYVLGAIISIGLIFFGNKKMSSKIPFGPFLIVGYFLILFFGENMIEWWKGLVAGSL